MPEPGYQTLVGTAYSTDPYQVSGFGDGFGASFNAPFNLIDYLDFSTWGSATGNPQSGGYAFADDFGYGLENPSPPLPTLRPPSASVAAVNGGQPVYGAMSGVSLPLLLVAGGVLVYALVLR
jgi:hypothetical protein